jgi:O-antigen/teichoic acid export membrane protein
MTTTDTWLHPAEGEERSSILGIRTPAFVEGARRHLQTSLYVNAYYLISNTAVSSLLGFVFWTAAARLYAPDEVGIASTTISTTALLAGLSSMGLELGLIRFLPGAGRMGAKMLDSTLTVVAISSLVFSAGFLIGLPLWSPALTSAYEDQGWWVVFGLLSVMATVGRVVDATFVAHRAARLTVLRQGILSILKIPLLLVFLNAGGALGIALSLMVAAGVSLSVTFAYMLPAVQQAYRPSPRLGRKIVADILPYALANHLADLLVQSPQIVLPLLTLNVLGPNNSGCLYVTWMIANLLFAVPRSVATSMVAEGANDEGALWENVKRALRVILLLLAPAAVLTSVGGHRLLLIFGGEYARRGRALLLILAISAFPTGVNHVYFAINRVRKRNWCNLVVGLLVAGVILRSSSLLMTRCGIAGAGVSWLVGEGMLSVFVVITLCRRDGREHLIGI